MKILPLLSRISILALAVMLAGCPFGSKEDGPTPDPGSGNGKQKVEVLKLDWDSASVSMEQTSRTVDNEANVIVVGSSDGCWGCKDWFLFAIVEQSQCGRNGWQCTARGNIDVKFEGLQIGKESSLGWQVNTGGKLTIRSIDGSPFISGTTATKNYQIQKIEIESHNDETSRNNGDLRIGTPECPAVNQNRLWQKSDEGDPRKLLVDVAAKMAGRKYALAIKVTDLNRWCASTSYAPLFTSLKGEKFSFEQKSVVTGTGEFIGQDLADLLIEDHENLYDYSQGSTYFWMNDEVNIITASDTIQYYKRGVSNTSGNMKFYVADLMFHFESNDSMMVMVEGYQSFEGTWKFADKTKYDRIIINGHDNGLGFGYDNVELKIDKLQKNVFNYTREIDLTKFDPYGTTNSAYIIEQVGWLSILEELRKPPLSKFKLQCKMVPYR
ncbi:hypothetical protein [Dyadobacter aurulentus]|uniref:hypothetical protein n=1 Tax=Dyadobacter sp. UC 10 TaxID=2605428 RepID=UPI0011F3A7D1|nr:hypothetical protein [Dyadobacter sp. UC 10]KAA0992430.1 hypothetical protein FXO21_20720 [Dyadobacter sp. UC 10]